jgi:hypothetical protein
MYWLLLLIASSVFAQVDLSAIRKLDDELPNYSDFKPNDEEVKFERQRRKFLTPQKIISLEEIQKSGFSYGSIKQGASLRNVETNEATKTFKQMYVRYFNLEDEQGFKYILGKDDTVLWKIRSKLVEPINEELSLSVPPTDYTPAPLNVVRTVYDKKLSVPPELIFYSGIVQGDFMADLFEDKKAREGSSYQLGLHLFTQWKLPVKAGVVVHYEKSTYELQGGGQVIYNSISIGSQVKTREYEILGQPIRLQMQMRVSPFARAEAETIFGNGTFKFNSTDVLLSIERPIKNSMGEFIIGGFSQTQWLNIKDQNVPVSLKASNETNKTFGVSLAQVFE